MDVEVLNPAKWLEELRRVAREAGEREQSFSAELMRIILDAEAMCSKCSLGGGRPCAMGCFLEGSMCGGEGQV